MQGIQTCCHQCTTRQKWRHCAAPTKDDSHDLPHSTQPITTMAVSMMNAWIIAKETGVKMSRLGFMENVIISLIGGHIADDPAPAAKGVTVKKDEPPGSRTVGQHWPVSGTKVRCVECYSAGHDSKKSHVLCEQCSVLLHIDCFKQLHKKKCNKFDKAELDIVNLS